MKLKITAITVLTAAVALVMTACGSAEDGKVTTTTTRGTSTTAATTAARTTDKGTSRTGEGLSEKISEGITELESGMSRMFDR